MNRKEELEQEILELERGVELAEDAYDDAVADLHNAENELLELEKLEA